MAQEARVSIAQFLAGALGTANPAAPAQAQQQTPNPTQPAAFQPSQTVAPTPQQPASPLDNHANLFKIADIKPEDRKLTLDDPYIDINPTTLNAEVAKLTFTDPAMSEQINAITGGNAAASEALVNLLNTFGRQVYGRGAQLSASLTDQATRQGVKRLSGEIPNAVRSNLTNEKIGELNPAFKHEALSPMVNALKAQYEKQNPNATSQEIAAMTQNYLSDVAKVLNPQAATGVDSHGNPASADFDGFF